MTFISYYFLYNNKFYINSQITPKFLRIDLRKNCTFFRKYGVDSLLLGYVSYNCGCVSLFGSKNKPQSARLKKLDIGNRNILYDLPDFCHYKTKVKDILISFAADR